MTPELKCVECETEDANYYIHGYCVDCIKDSLERIGITLDMEPVEKIRQRASYSRKRSAPVNRSHRSSTGTTVYSS